MTERRRPLEHDDGQGALFGGEAFARTGPAPAWKRPARAEAAAPANADATPFESAVEADTLPAPGMDARASQAFAPDEQHSEARLPAPQAFEPGCTPADAGPTSPRPSQPLADAPLGLEPAARSAGRAPDADTTVSAPGAPFADELAELERATEGHARRPRAPLAGPTLDDMMSRVWEGLTTGLPAACPVCHGEVVPALSGPPHGRCSSCGTMID
jgi:hypothetical protein